MSASDQICELDTVTLARRIAAKEISPVEALDAVLARLDRLEPKLNMFATVAADQAREQAKQVEADLAAGREVGPLAGVPTGIKDLICTRDIRTASGSQAYADFVPDEDDVVVERITAAGAVVLGKTQVPEFGFSGTGQTPLAEPTRNPWNPERTSGGSSAGSGAAVAAGVGPFSLGSDGGGSIRIPASFCGVYGFKPTMGRVPLYPGTKDERYPGVSSWESLEHIGPLTRTVADAALVLSVIAGYDERDRLSIRSDDVDWLRAADGDLRGLRVAYSPDFGYAPVDPAVRAVVDQAAAVFERDLGCSVERADPGWEDPYDALLPMILCESDLAGLRRMAEDLGDRMSPHLAEVLRADWTAEQLTTAVMRRKAVYNASWRFFREYDLLLTPTVPVTAFEHGLQGPASIDGREIEAFSWLSFTFPFNFTGQPAATVPAGFTEEGLPVGLQIVGRRMDDALVLRASAAFEAAAPWHDRRPPILIENVRE
ncbi:amidase family protein [Amycolatopsis carbonis]|uniref:Amidase family protein n=1 Tax=Amycolatopsis carbonis TaxID=715471 RepID=A0A9Y2MP72_9PSEU|nr:amidase family protein [Amycolatopsis sp. 2-15]WIX75685.1 amidase family protein [Amycolatopsis sp. 2-15]